VDSTNDSRAVVDGSIMPTLVSANTNLPITMIAERASELLRADLGGAT
jgi:choline dehydrogenase